MIESLVCLPACPHSNNLRSSRVLVDEFGEIVDSVFDDHPDIVFVIVLADLLPAVMGILVLVVAFGLSMRVLLVVMTLMVIFLALLFVGLAEMLVCSFRRYLFIQIDRGR